MEYPPGALAVFLPPSAFGSSHYNATFKCLMALCGVATLLLLAWLLVRLGVSTTRLWVAVLIFALSPLALGPISLNTYDAWPALLTLAALALLLAGRDVAAFALLGAAFAAKVYPLVLVPPAAIFVWRTRGRELALRALAAFAAVAALFVVPFLVLAPHGLAESFRAQAARSLQVESLGGSLLAVADRLGLVRRHGRASHRARDLVRPRRLVAGDAGRGELDRAGSRRRGGCLALPTGSRRAEAAHARLRAAIAGFLAFTRFFSPQYLVWLVPFVVLLEPVVWVLVAAALVLAQVWFFHYSDVFALGGYVWLVLVRDLIVAALFVFALVKLGGRASEDEDPVLLEHELPLRVSS